MASNYLVTYADGRRIRVNGASDAEGAKKHASIVEGHRAVRAGAQGKPLDPEISTPTEAVIIKE